MIRSPPGATLFTPSGTTVGMRPNAPLVGGITLVVLGTVGYAVGVVAAYPGRSFAATGAMVGIALLAVGGGRAAREARS